MDHFAGLDVSVKETNICIVDDTGKIVREVKVASEPQALLKVLGNQAYRFKRIGLEADIARCSRHVANVPTNRSQIRPKDGSAQAQLVRRESNPDF
jgi:hypothetical protein